ncbi:MAG: hypothetical protein FWH15_06450 [Betaproteobacteria bacterium]|nr:hypothetical protein [Betaproteobacteria bacterium]
MLLKTGSAIIERLKQKCPSADGKVFASADLADVAENAQAAPALYVVLQSYTPEETMPTGAIRWQEIWYVVAMVKHVGRQDRALALMEAGAVMLEEVLAALGKYRYQLEDSRRKNFGMLEVIAAAEPYIGDVYAYFPLGFKATVTTPGSDSAPFLQGKAA